MASHHPQKRELILRLEGYKGCVLIRLGTILLFHNILTHIFGWIRYFCVQISDPHCILHRGLTVFLFCNILLFLSRKGVGSWRDREKQKIDEWGPSRKEGDEREVDAEKPVRREVEVRREEPPIRRDEPPIRRDDRPIRRDDDRGPRRVDDGPGRLSILWN